MHMVTYGNLYDLYAARSVGAGKSPGTFLSYLNSQQIPSAVALSGTIGNESTN